MKFTSEMLGTCAYSVDFELTDGTVSNVVFLGGCNGNLKAIAKLVEGMEAREVVSILQGNKCGRKDTSCADQFARALLRAIEEDRHYISKPHTNRHTAKSKDEED